MISSPGVSSPGAVELLESYIDYHRPLVPMRGNCVVGVTGQIREVFTFPTSSPHAQAPADSHRCRTVSSPILDYLNVLARQTYICHKLAPEYLGS